MKSQKKISRKHFLKWIASLTLIPFGIGWVTTVSRQQKKDKLKTMTVSSAIEQGVSFQGPLIIIRENEIIRFFSSKCPHLGCRISKIENDHLVCPCHGSTFSKEGINTKGPANRSLSEFMHTVDEDTGDYLIEIG